MGQQSYKEIKEIVEKKKVKDSTASEKVETYRKKINRIENMGLGMQLGEDEKLGEKVGEIALSMGGGDFRGRGMEVLNDVQSSAEKILEKSKERRKEEIYDMVPYYGLWNVYQHNAQLDREAEESNKRAAGEGHGEFRSSRASLAGYFVPGLTTWSHLRSMQEVWKVYQEYSGVLQRLALRMADIQTLLRTMEQVNQVIQSSPSLEKAYGGHLAGIRKLLQRVGERSEVGSMLYYLRTFPYNNYRYLLNHTGKLLASHKLFLEHKDVLADAMYALGKMDAHLGVVSLLQDTKTESPGQHYTFTQFLDGREKPYMQLQGMWNPFLSVKEAVSNKVLLGDSVRNIILTGPNAGGKSTYLVGTAVSVLLSQSLGIAPAQQAVMTPFQKVNTSIDITDDIAAGKSLFMAEVDRAQEHLRMLEALPSGAFSFSIFDEPFSGTNPVEGAAAEYSILEKMAGYTNTFNMVATHYPIVMFLEKKAPGRGFRNRKVYITYEQVEGEKQIKYTYKILPGKATQAIALDILEEQGYDTTMLRDARDIINHPERYQATFK